MMIVDMCENTIDEKVVSNNRRNTKRERDGREGRILSRKLMFMKRKRSKRKNVFS